MLPIISPSLLASDFARLGEEIRSVEKAGADWIHVDVMDGHFVPNITIGPLIVEAVRRSTNLPIDVHLMIENPQLYIADFVKAGANYISVHWEEGYHLDRSLQMIHSLGAKAGVALNPATPVSVLKSILPSADFILIMTVNPGFGGQKFLPYCAEKISELQQMIEVQKLSTVIEVDGGVSDKNIGDLYQRGARAFVAGSAVFQSTSYEQSIQNMKKACQ